MLNLAIAHNSHLNHFSSCHALHIITYKVIVEGKLRNFGIKILPTASAFKIMLSKFNKQKTSKGFHLVRDY